MAKDPRKPRTEGSEPQPLDEAIRCRAYELYEQRGREDGHEIDDWLIAEAELTQKEPTVAA